MCGRYTITSFDNLQAELGLAALPAPAAPRYNIAPGQMVPVVKNQDERALTPVRWGLVPYWAEDPSVGNRMINARCESVTTKPAFRNALSRRRCLVVADGFYEWQKPAGDGGAARGRGAIKIPHYIHRRSGAPFGMAGLWERWKAPDGTWLESCAIITCEANALMRPIHGRMPLILDRASYDRWLDPAPLPPEELEALLHTPPVRDFEAYRVSTLVNAPQHDEPACIEPAPPGAQNDAQAEPEARAEAAPGPRTRAAAGSRQARPRGERKQRRSDVQPSLFDHTVTGRKP
jgi:putative SOS response-associated peptidase YedK